MTETTEFPNHWKKGIFHRGEFRKYLKVMPRGDLECMFFMQENKEEGCTAISSNLSNHGWNWKIIKKK